MEFVDYDPILPPRRTNLSRRSSCQRVFSRDIPHLWRHKKTNRDSAGFRTRKLLHISRCVHMASKSESAALTLLCLLLYLSRFHRPTNWMAWKSKDNPRRGRNCGLGSHGLRVSIGWGLSTKTISKNYCRSWKLPGKEKMGCNVQIDHGTTPLNLKPV